MKNMGLLLIALTITSQAFAGSRILSCEGDDGDSVNIYENTNGIMVAVVTSDSVGGSGPQDKYLVTETPPPAVGSRRLIVGRGFALDLSGNGHDFLNVPEIGIHEHVTCKY